MKIEEKIAEGLLANKKAIWNLLVIFTKKFFDKLEISKYSIYYEIDVFDFLYSGKYKIENINRKVFKSNISLKNNNGLYNLILKNNSLICIMRISFIQEFIYIKKF